MSDLLPRAESDIDGVHGRTVLGVAVVGPTSGTNVQSTGCVSNPVMFVAVTTMVCGPGLDP